MGVYIYIFKKYCSKWWDLFSGFTKLIFISFVLNGTMIVSLIFKFKLVYILIFYKYISTFISGWIVISS